MIKIGFAEPCMDYIDNPERVLTLHNQNEADVFCDAAALVRLPVADRPGDGRDVDVIVTRGFDSKPLERRYPGVPLIELRIAACELYDSVRACRERFGSREIAVIMPRGMLPAGEFLAEALGSGARFYELTEAADRRALLQRAVREGCDCVLSGRTVCRLAGELGVDSMLLRPREDSVYSSITQAKRLALRAKRTRETPSTRCIVFDHDALEAARRPAAKRAYPAAKRGGSNVLFYRAEAEALPSVQSVTPNA